MGAENVMAQDTPAYDYDFNASVLCGADWYGIRRSEGSHSIHNYYIVLGDQALDEEGYPVAGSTVYALDLFGGAPADERNPQPPVGTYTFSSEIKDKALYHDIHVYQLDGNGNYELDRDFIDGRLELSTYEKDGNTYYKYEAFLTDELGKSHHVLYESRFIEYNDFSQGSSVLEKDVNFTCTSASGRYNSLADGVMSVSLELSSLLIDDEGQYSYEVLPACTMHIELYMPSGTSLANGTYTISDYAGDEFTLDSGELVSIAGVEYPVGSYVDYIFGNKSLAWGCVTSGTLTVSGEGDNKTISADFLTDYGFSVKFSYSGVLAIKGIPQTGLTENMVLDLTGASAQFECVGDVDRLNNCRNWYITILPADGYDHGFISYICSRGKTFFDGIVTETYTASPSRTPWKGEYSKGKKNDAGQLSGTWALTGFDENGQPQVNAPAVDGDLNITRHDDGKTYTIQFDLNDGIGHNFKGEWTGEPELVNSCGDVDEAGIDGVLQDSSLKVTGIYDLNGVMVSEPTRGVYIIRYSDGSVSKKIIK